MYFVAIVLFVYDDYFSFVSLCDHCVVLVTLVVDFFCNV